VTISIGLGRINERGPAWDRCGPNARWRGGGCSSPWWGRGYS